MLLAPPAASSGPAAGTGGSSDPLGGGPINVSSILANLTRMAQHGSGSVAPAASPNMYPGTGSQSVLAALHAAISGNAQSNALARANADSQQQAAAHSPAAAQLTEQQILQSMVGNAPQAVAPPTLSDFWNPAPYDQVINQVQGAGKQASAADDSIYAQALKQAMQAGSMEMGQANQTVANAKQTQAQNNAFDQQAFSGAMSGLAPGEAQNMGLGANLATLEDNNSRATQMANFFKQMVGNDNSNTAQNMAMALAGAKTNLGTAVNAQVGKDQLQKASDAAKANELYQQALNANANSNAARTSSYATAMDNAIKQYQSLSMQNAITPQQQVSQELNGPNLLNPAVEQAATDVLFGVPGASGAQAPFAGAPKSSLEATQRLQALAGSLKLDPTGLAAVKQMIGTYFSPSVKQPADPNQMAALLAQISNGTY